MITRPEHSYIPISSLSEEERDILDTLQDKKDKILLGGEGFRPFSWEHEKEALSLSTSYFLGIDWLVENRLSLHVQSKLDSHQERLNYLEIFSNAFHALDDFSEADRKEWMKNLFWIDFKAPRIPLLQTQADGLLLFLIVLFLPFFILLIKKVPARLPESHRLRSIRSYLSGVSGFPLKSWKGPVQSRMLTAASQKARFRQSGPRAFRQEKVQAQLPQ